MSKKDKQKNRRRKATGSLVVVAIILLVVIVWFVAQKTGDRSTATKSNKPVATSVRTVENFCKARKTEMARLKKLGDIGTDIESVFANGTYTLDEIATSFDNVGRYAPDGIRGDLESVTQAYHAAASPSADSHALIQAVYHQDSNLYSWVTKNCGRD